MLWTQYPDEIDRSALQLVWDAWKGQWPDDKAAAGLALFNVAGYAAEKALGQPDPAVRFGATDYLTAVEERDDTDIEAAFTAAMATQDGTERSFGLVPWGLILSIAVKLFQEWLSRQT